MKLELSLMYLASNIFQYILKEYMTFSTAMSAQQLWSEDRETFTCGAYCSGAAGV